MINNRLKLSYISSTRFPNRKAHGLAIAKMCEAFSQVGFDVQLIVPDRLQPRGIKLLSWQKLYSIRTLFTVTNLKCIDLYRIDKFLPLSFQTFIFLGTSFFFYLSVLIYMLFHKTDMIYTREIWLVPFLKIIGKPIFVELHDIPTHKTNQKIWAYWLRKVKGIICINTCLEKEVIKMGVNSSSLWVLPSGYDSKVYGRINRGWVREKYAIPQDKSIIMYTGTISREKGLDTLLEAAELLKEQEDILFVIVGGSVLKQFADYIQEVSIKAKALGNVLMLGYKPSGEIPSLLQSADILLLPNTKKKAHKIFWLYTSPLKLFDYMAAGRPIIASNVPALHDIVTEKVVTYYKADDALSLVSKIQEVISDKKRFAHKSQIAHNLVKQYSWENRALHIKSILNETVVEMVFILLPLSFDI